MPKVFFRFPYGDFPQYKQGDLVEKPSPELLERAQSSACLEIWPDDDQTPESPPQPEPAPAE